MFAAIPFPCSQSRNPPVEPGLTFNKPTESLFGQCSTVEPTTAPDCMVPSRNNTWKFLGDPVPALQNDNQESPFEKNDLQHRKLNLTVETLEKQSYFLSLQIWHYECQYGLPHSEFSRQFDFGAASPIPSRCDQDQEESIQKDSEVDPGEGPSVVKSEPEIVSDKLVIKEESMDDSDDTIEEKVGLWTEEHATQPSNLDKSSSEGIFGSIQTEKSSEAPVANETSFGNLFGPPSTGINFGSFTQPSTNIFGGNFQTKPQPPAASSNFRLPQVSATGKASTEETSQLSHRQQQLTVETMQKQSHLLSLKILQYEYRHRIPHSEFSRKIALQSTMNGRLPKEAVATEDEAEPIDYTMSSGN